MKKLLLLILALAMTTSLSACGGETSTTSQSEADVEAVTLVDVTTVDNIKVKLPSEMIFLENIGYGNAQTADVAIFMVLDAGPATVPYTDWTQADFEASQLSAFNNVVITSFENDFKIGGNPALVCHYTYTTAGGSATTSTIVLITNSTVEAAATFQYLTDNSEGSLAKNLQACIDSIVIPTA